MRLAGSTNSHSEIIAPSIYGGLLIIATLLSTFLPETSNKALPVSLEEVAYGDTRNK